MAEVPAKLALPAPRAEHISLLVARSAAFIVCVLGGVVLLATATSLIGGMTEISREAIAVMIG